MHRIPALDGVRGIAIIFVLATNFHWGVLRGGYLGVDIFFVLSGFLITSLLLAERERSGRIRYRAFLVRRALRLLPALVALLSALVSYALLFGSEAVRRSTLVASAYALGYVGNWYMAFGGDSAFATMGELAHTWSLSVEEQFYLIWPLVLVLLLHAGVTTRRLVRVLIGLVVIVALWRSWLWANDATWLRLYFGTDTRGDGLLVGCALGALTQSGALQRLHLGVSRALAWSCGAVLVLLVLFAPQNSPFMYAMGGYTIAGLAAAGALQNALTESDTRFTRFLGQRWLAAVGRVSYGIYLWHLPIASVIAAAESAPLQVRIATELLRLLVLAACTIVSYWLIELPFLRWKQRLSAG